LKLVRSVLNLGRLRLAEPLVGQDVVVRTEYLLVLDLELLEANTLLLALALGASRLRRKLLWRVHVMLSEAHVVLARFGSCRALLQ
jgi:hypothetical protein